MLRRRQVGVVPARLVDELQAEDDEQLTKLLEAVEISLNDKTVTIRFRGSPEDVSELIEKAWDKQLRLK